MSLVDRESTPARIAASQANGKKSQGPITPEGKARVSLNALKTGTYAKSERALREIMVRKGEDPDDFEQLHQGLTEEWQPEFVTEAMLVKTIAEKGFDKAQLRAAWMESQLNSLRVAEIQEQLPSGVGEGLSDSYQQGSILFENRQLLQWLLDVPVPSLQSVETLPNRPCSRVPGVE